MADVTETRLTDPRRMTMIKRGSTCESIPVRARGSHGGAMTTSCSVAPPEAERVLGRLDAGVGPDVIDRDVVAASGDVVAEGQLPNRIVAQRLGARHRSAECDPR